MLLRFSPAGGDAEEYLEGHLSMPPMIGVLPGGKFLFPGISSGTAHLLAGPGDAEALPFLQTAEASARPFAASVDGTVAFDLGKPPRRRNE
jgi:hypothetical protein